jgi:signal transduction histidine kinase
MDEVDGVRIVATIPYERIHAQANATFIRTMILLSLLTLSTVASVVFLEEVALLRYLRKLASAARRFGSGDFSVRLSMPKQYNELEKMADAFNFMASTLETRHAQLVAAYAELNDLAHHLEQARESERSRIARDLHDEIGQVLTSIKMDLRVFGSSCSKKGTQLLCQPDIEVIRSKLDGLVTFAREVASSLRPPALDGAGLPNALRALARNTERNSDLTINVQTDVDEPFDWLVATNIYRIVQECLTNVVKHADAHEVLIHLSATGDTLCLRVTDDGQGLSGEANSKSLGIIGMRERSRMLGGTFSISSSTTGTTVEALIPLKRSVETCISC